MQLRFEIPESFWSLFRSVNRETYIEALMAINEEYQYSNYFLTREVCLQILSDRNTQKRIRLQQTVFYGYGSLYSGASGSVYEETDRT